MCRLMPKVCCGIYLSIYATATDSVYHKQFIIPFVQYYFLKQIMHEISTSSTQNLKYFCCPS